jgi:hypothetical protein
MIKSCVAAAAVLCAAVATPAPGQGQVFLASRAHPDFTIGPLFVVANVSQDVPHVTVNLSWSLTTRPITSKADIAQDLYLLWPAEIMEPTAPGPADAQLVRDVEHRGLSVVSSGRLVLRRRDRMLLGTAALGEPVAVLSTDVSRRIRRRRRARRRFAAATASANGVPSRDSLVALIPAGTHYEEVVAQFGRPDEEQERVTPPGRRTIIYRAANGSEQNEVAIELHDDRVREVTCVTTR